ncbi:serine/threonine-protein kinase [Myxococcus sp. RHSTA-1-4]|uniref:serine/threonine protein kinase n=1 Tax=Myxococcus sp. RHSTA-1-4 TaxID=2874601 RepID=UPI001CC12E12|nr:serine/threonine-protein kinase [Myxococcus sp. RHSTA-1-4]MBZ4419050.1 serine/threonine protein kinase [Myxococcus sp. RHSTA-1-4]
MATTPIHPDQLVPGSRIGPWRVLASLGAGGFGRAFQVERDEQPGRTYTLKVALRPASPHTPEEEDVEGRMAREVAIHMAYDTGLKIHAVDHWPILSGFLYFVTDYVEGETFHEWCWRTQPSAARLLTVYTEVVRQVGALHQRGVCHRDLKADNILIRKADERPLVLDYGVARLPGTATVTVGVPPTSPYLLPPECVTFLGQETWRQGARFDPGVPGDLYALGMLLYEALTDGYAFHPKLPYDLLMAAIVTRVPAAPHVLNPKVPRALSDIAMRLLAKRPEERYPDVSALLQALWEAAKERKQPDWQVSLALPPPEDQSAPAGGGGHRDDADPPPRASGEEAPAAVASEAAPEPAGVDPRAPVPERADSGHVPVRRRRLRWLWALRALLVLFLALWLGLSTLAPTPEKGSPHVPTATPKAPLADAPRSGPATFLAAALCAVAGVACSAAQVRPEPAECPEEAREAMFRVLGVDTTKGLKAVVDINQPGDQSQLGTYGNGKVVGRIAGYSWADPALPDGTLLYGQLWTGLVDEYGRPAAMARYSEAKLPDGRTFPVCIVLGNPDGRVRTQPGSNADASVLPRELPVSAVERWP